MSWCELHSPSDVVRIDSTVDDPLSVEDAHLGLQILFPARELYFRIVFFADFELFEIREQHVVDVISRSRKSWLDARYLSLSEPVRIGYKIATFKILTLR